jgi:hypothetical protein
MAVRNYTVIKETVNMKVIQWSGLLNGDTGQPYEFSGKYPDKSVQAFGTFGASPHCYIKGTNELVAAPAHFQVLNDPQGTALDLVAEKVEQVLENTNLIRPEAAGDGTLNLTVLLCVGK